jgi:hypothetical protein
MTHSGSPLFEPLPENKFNRQTHPIGTTPTRAVPAVPGPSSGQSAASLHLAPPHTTCALGCSGTSSWRRPRSADGTGCARGSSTAPTSKRSRSSRRGSYSPLSAPVRPRFTFGRVASFFSFFFIFRQHNEENKSQSLRRTIVVGRPRLIDPLNARWCCRCWCRRSRRLSRRGGRSFGLSGQ